MSDETSDRVQMLVDRVLQHDQEALAELFSMYRDRLWRMVKFRLDRRLHNRVDADDILQETYLAAVQRMDNFLHEANRSCFLWLRWITIQTMVDVHRRHLGTQKRDARKDRSIHGGWDSASTSMSLSFHLLGHLTSPSNAALRAELSEQVEAALAGMNDIDREVLALRHFEELTNGETAQVLQISEQAASVRYIRALSRLKTILKVAGFVEA
mgnify:CR=1 FL=1